MKTNEKTAGAGPRALAAFIGLVLAGLPGLGAAAGTDKITLVKLAPDAPGMIRFDSCARPLYPDEDLKAKHEGTVTLRLLIGVDGKVKDGRVAASSGHRSLDRAALAGLALCSFHPPVADGKPVQAWTHVQYVWKAE